MMNPMLSIILPCYHVEGFLPTILANLRAQTFQDIEIILVNDGGGEHQLQLMHQLKGDDEKTTIINRKNGGLSSARNAGLDVAKGRYIIFIDPDDEVKPFYLKYLYEAISSENADIAIGGYVVNYEREKRVLNDFLDCSIFGEDRNWNMRKLLSMLTIRNSVCNKIYRKVFLEEYSLHFNEQLFYGEDEVFNMQCFLHTNQVALIPECGYIYMCRDSNSICSKYIKQYKEEKELMYSIYWQVMDKIGMTEKQKNEILLGESYLLGYFMLCNLFKKDSPLSFREKKEYIHENILSNILIEKSYIAFKKKQNNMFTSIYNFCFSLHNAFFMAVVFQILYSLKYRCMKLYIILAPYLKKI